MRRLADRWRGHDIWTRTGRGSGRLARLARLPRADWGKAVAHAGLGVTMAGIAGMMAWEAEDIRVMQEGDSLTIAGYTLTLDDVRRVEGPNYSDHGRSSRWQPDGREIGTAAPEKRNLSRGADAHDRGRAR